ncbi:tRNA-dihydrouridine synthase [Reinekea marina]|uniref:tRNA-dihydrouridine(16) synthase n=1 Tax=Reinekea marina TaxID=1310421 RepID=A0ABV7WR33_9GAMM|nr:tRNA-dihydrouridine synthase [Reinekea marina]MDN3650315.1 tRNA-dihydrouridine synthase [Reinekea marina]
MKVLLAPMEGLADAYLREILSNAAGYDLITSEFVRIVDQLLPKRTFFDQVPELKNNSQTSNGTPVRVQLLGNHPEMMASNALRATELGSFGIDLNFGCPSKTVNKSKGGAVMLTDPESIYQTVSAVHSALPPTQPLSAKMRLGYEDSTLMMECAQAIADGGAQAITIHARTKSQGYTPPAYWHLVKHISDKLDIEKTINGDIWTLADAHQALKDSGCDNVMIGRGAIKNPKLADCIKKNQDKTAQWSQTAPLVKHFWMSITQEMSNRYCAGRLKQWLNYLKDQYPEAEALFVSVRRLTDINDIQPYIEAL